MRKLCKGLLTAALVVSMSLTGLNSNVYADNYASESLNNKTDGTVSVEKVDSVNNTGKFKVNMSDTHDVIKIYKLADMNYNESTNSFDSPSWVPEVTAWLANSADGGGSAYAAYSTPALLGQATKAIQTEFYKKLMDYIKDSNNEAAVAGLVSYDSKVDTSYISTTSGQNKVVITADNYASLGYEQGDNGDGTYYYYLPETPDVQLAEGAVIQEATSGYFEVTNVPIGIYIIAGQSDGGGKTYSPATINLVPERDGVSGSWYLNQDLSVILKSADVSMEKKINGKDSDIVHVGEDVDFQINFTLPKYSEREINNSTAQYTLTFDDDLSDQFTLDESSVVIKYRTSTDTAWEDATDFPDGYYSSFISKPAVDTDGDNSVLDEYGLVLYGCSTEHLSLYTIYRNYYRHYISTADASSPAVSGYIASDSTHNKPYATGAIWDAEKEQYYLNFYAYYYYRDGAYHLIKNDVANKPYETYYGSGSTLTVPVTPSATELSPNQIRAVYSSETHDTINHGWQYFPYGTGSYAATTDPYYHNVFNITFDYQKILKDSALYNSDVEVQITYKAQVNRNAEVGSEANTNTATMKYEANAAGTLFTTISDTVKAYTYGLNVLKVDGDTDGTDSVKYLSGAVFKLYMETDKFVDEAYDSSVENSPTASDAQTLTFEEYTAKYPEGGDYYYYEYEEADEVNGNHKVLRVFKLCKLKDSLGTYFDGTITSVASADGVTQTGLDVGNYILKEITPPTGYNELAEDLLFSIYKMDDEKATSEYGGSYALFASDEDGTTIDFEDGVYDMKVLNYAGLTLPSTGGMGTIIFTIIGLLIMLAVLIVIVKKNKKNAANIAGFMAIVLVAGFVVTSNAQDVYAITEVSLNNKYGTLVTGDGTVDFKIETKDSGDQVEVYKIAELTWDSTANTYNGPSWTLGVEQAIEASAEYKDYTTPMVLGEQSVDVQIAFLDWLYENKALNNLETAMVSATKIKLSADGNYYTISDVPYGIYLVKASNGAKTYQLLTVDAMPTQQGPVGAWYLSKDITATLKFSNISVSKTIDGKAGETVTTGQNVQFDIFGEVPDYPGVDNGDGTKNYDGYVFAMTDTMSAAFDYDSTKGLTVEYTTDATVTDATVWTPLATSAYTSIFAKPAASVTSEGLMLFYDSSNNKNIYCNVSISGTAYTLTWYSYIADTGVLSYLGQTTGTGTLPSSTSDQALLTAYEKATGITSTKFTRDSLANFVGLSNVTFDYATLHTLGAKNVRITYNATVTPSAVVGTDDNSNTATFYYQKNLAGDIDTTSGKAYAWTYALNLTKVDGDKTNTYLAGAKFKMYKEAYTYVPNADGLSTGSGDYENYVFLKDAAGGTTAPTGVIEDGQDAVDLDTLAKIEAEIGGDNYYRIVDVTGACADEECKATGDHKHIIVYSLYTYKDADGTDKTEIESVATAAGVTVTGLAPASYVLIETEAPAGGYNKLQEAIRFEIIKFTEEEATGLGLMTADNVVSLKSFYSEETISDDDYAALDEANKADYVRLGDKYYRTYQDGTYPIQVKNYTGLTLPSTGGMGTLLFTIIGIMIMTMVMVVVIIKKKKTQY